MHLISSLPCAKLTCGEAPSRLLPTPTRPSQPNCPNSTVTISFWMIFGKLDTIIFTARLGGSERWVTLIGEGRKYQTAGKGPAMTESSPTSEGLWRSPSWEQAWPALVRRNASIISTSDAPAQVILTTVTAIHAQVLSDSQLYFMISCCITIYWYTKYIHSISLCYN